ncbi:DUF2807 domain-containing protein [Phenylobacterium sp.]|uniref:GIN domain-containing protein n=1 Tax=Phenylobacterium sp. TaxID=1871053 RepID=UPI0025E23B52|nr:DUF2807 domain-containing protein [Phenylobacterium sp.]
MRLQIALLVAAAAFTAGAAQAASVEIRDAAARVTVVPEDRNDVKVEIVAPNARLPLTVRTEGDRTVIDGDLYHRIRGCHGMGQDGRIGIRGVGDVRWSEMPQVVIHTPRAVAIVTNGAVQGAIGRAGSLDLHNSGCSAWTIADVAGDVTLQESGAGSVRMGASSRLDVRLSGAANIHATHVRQGLEARLSGVGDVRVDQLDGAMDAQVSGVGKVDVDGGRASLVHASVSGMGSVAFGGVASDLDASISGLGSVRVQEVTGSIRKSISGGGSVQVAKRPI